MAKSINDKLKESVQKSLTQSGTPKHKKKTEVELQTERGAFFESIGINPVSQHRQKVTVYKLQYHNRAHLDHTKYPFERNRPVTNSPMFATFKEANKECRKREKEDPKNIYFCHMTSVYVNEIPAKLLKKLKERGWGFHS